LAYKNSQTLFFGEGLGAFKIWQAFDFLGDNLPHFSNQEHLKKIEITPLIVLNIFAR